MADEEGKTAESNTQIQEQGTIIEQPTQTETQGQTQTEPEIDLGGEKVPLSQVKKWKEDFGNDSKWKDKNKRESEELNRRREELRELELIATTVKQRPEILQQLFAPSKPERNFDNEYQELYSKMPDQLSDPNGFQQWQYRRDQFLLERAREEGKQESLKEFATRQAVEHNTAVETYGKETYLSKGKVDDSEFRMMTQWIVDNVKPRNGMYDKKAYDVAFQINFPEKWAAESKIETAKSAVAPLLKTTRGGAEGGLKTTDSVQTTAQDEDDAKFIQALSQAG